MPKSIWYNRQQRLFSDYFLKEFQGHRFSFISQNCLGQRFYKLQKSEYLSPTIGLWMKPQHYFDMAEDLESYLNSEIEYSESESLKYGHPVGRIKDSVIYFQHYSNFRQACQSWKRRSGRVNCSNFFLICTDRDGFGESDFERFVNFPSKKKILFTINHKWRHENVILLPSKQNENHVSDLYTHYNLLNKRRIKLELRKLLLDRYN